MESDSPAGLTSDLSDMLQMLDRVKEDLRSEFGSKVG